MNSIMRHKYIRGRRFTVYNNRIVALLDNQEVRSTLVGKSQERSAALERLVVDKVRILMNNKADKITTEIIDDINKLNKKHAEQFGIDKKKTQFSSRARLLAAVRRVIEDEVEVNEVGRKKKK